MDIDDRNCSIINHSMGFDSYAIFGVRDSNSSAASSSRELCLEAANIKEELLSRKCVCTRSAG